jgi:quinol monooxygenase YgiN
VVIVAGHFVVDPWQRESYLASCVPVVEQARQATGCLGFAISADLLDAGRIDIFERWESQAAVEAFRRSGPSDEQSAAMLALPLRSTTSPTSASSCSGLPALCVP